MGRFGRRITVVSLLLVGGAIVNVAVAWGSVYWSGKPGVPEFRELDDREAAQYWDALARPDWPPPPALHGILETNAIGVSGGAVNTLSRQMFNAVIWQDHGLPLRALRSVILMEGRQIVHERRITLHGRSLPVCPIPFGFVINTLFYAVLLWLLLAAPGIGRRALRRKRRVCERCAYPIGVSAVCTECGAAVEATGANGATASPPTGPRDTTAS